MTVSVRGVETRQLELCEPTTEDFEVLGDLWRDKKVRQFLGGAISDQDIESKIGCIQDHWKQYGFGQFRVSIKNTHQIIGLCGLNYTEEGSEISYMFFPAYWGRGLASEAILASLYYGFNVLNLEKILAVTQEVNQKSWGLLEKMGMHYINAIWRFGEEQRVYMLNRQEWLSEYKQCV